MVSGKAGAAGRSRPAGLGEWSQLARGHQGQQARDVLAPAVAEEALAAAVAAGATISRGVGEGSGSTMVRAAGEGLASGELSGLAASGGCSDVAALAALAEADEDDEPRFALRCRWVFDVE